MIALTSLIAASFLPGSLHPGRHTILSPRSHGPVAAVAPHEDKDKDIDMEMRNKAPVPAPAMLYEKTPNGLSYKDLSAGEGDAVPSDGLVSIAYKATFLSTGELVEQTSPNRPLTFMRGEARSAIFDEAIEGMNEGAKRRVLVLPSSKWALYDKETIDFEIELVELKTGTSAALYQLGGVARTLARTAFFCFWDCLGPVVIVQGILPRALSMICSSLSAASSSSSTSSASSKS